MTAIPIVVGIIGGVASGKSEVAIQLVRRGAALINADELGHSLLLDSAAIRSSVVALLGSGVLDASNKIDRKAIAGLVFGSDDTSRRKRTELEAILHPAIRHAAEAALEKLRRNPKLRMIVLDAPLLIEANWRSLCDEIIFVDTPLQVRQQLAIRREWSVDELQRREAAQMSLGEKRAAATTVIVNDGDIEQLRTKVNEWWNDLRFEI